MKIDRWMLHHSHLKEKTLFKILKTSSKENVISTMSWIRIPMSKQMHYKTFQTTYIEHAKVTKKSTSTQAPPTFPKDAHDLTEYMQENIH